MRHYYNEWDKPTAAWLRELGDRHHLPSGHVDTRSIRDVRPDDVIGFDQCHFFAGIGGWPLALRWAGLENVPGIWTGSPPCQPFSVAGKGLGQSDERHLAPVWLDLIRECRPVAVFGEQVADAIGRGWLDDLFDALERESYTCGAVVLPACGVGAPHTRKRLFFGAVRLDDTTGTRHIRSLCGAESQTWNDARVCMSRAGRADDRMADAHRGISHRTGPFRASRGLEYPERGSAGWLADANGGDASAEGIQCCGQHRQFAENCRTGRLAHAAGTRRGQVGCHTSGDRKTHEGRAGNRHGDGSPDDLGSGLVGTHGAHPHHSFWSDSDWLGCRDGKLRPVRSGSQPLAHGVPARVGRLRGYGNAIVPQVAAIFIEEFLGAVLDIGGA